MTDTAFYTDALDCEAFGHEAVRTSRGRDPVFTRIALGIPEPTPGGGMAVILAIKFDKPFPFSSEEKPV